jgi:hypothetical protein
MTKNDNQRQSTTLAILTESDSDGSTLTVQIPKDWQATAADGSQRLWLWTDSASPWARRAAHGARGLCIPRGRAARPPRAEANTCCDKQNKKSMAA